MRTYLEIKTFFEWTNEEQNQFALAVTKGLILDMVRKANSGHSGGPMSSADFTQILFTEYLNFDPKDPEWFNRDRFVLSAGHESALIYSILTQLGWLNIEDIQNFRQLHSRTPGHPEVEIPGIEATTGPLGQGFGMAVGMATAESMLRSRIGELIDHFTYVVAGDGDFQEPVLLGSASMAGHWGLSRLIVFYDSNNAQISGKVERSDSTNYAQVFEGFGWHVQEIDGHNHAQIREALEKAQVVDRPSLIIGTTIMAKGSATMEGDHETHGAPLPQDEINKTKEKLGLPPDSFYLPLEVVSHFQNRFQHLEEKVNDWNGSLTKACKDKNFKSLWDKTVNDQLEDIKLPRFERGTSVATRKAFGVTLDEFSEQMPSLVGGSADLEPSNYTGNFAKRYGDFNKENRSGRNLAFGVREFPMAAAMNGIALHGGLIPFGATFLVFADYERPALRLAAIQNCRVIHEFTHDSFWVGEDGPTHQPVEHATSLRIIPNLDVWRPCDAVETLVAWGCMLDRVDGPSCLLATRQGVPNQDKTSEQIENITKGAYVLSDAAHPVAVILATGSEVSLAIDAQKLLQDEGIATRVVSLPSTNVFDRQDVAYRDKILPKTLPKVAVEAGVTDFWRKYVGTEGAVVGIDTFGESAPADALYEHFEITVQAVASAVKSIKH
jgi:transketolase